MDNRNSLGLLRLAAALLVLFSHQFALLGDAEPTLLSITTLGGVAVSIFFTLSGTLVWISWCNDPNVPRFFMRRLWRLLPALVTVTLLTVFLLGPITSSLDHLTYFTSPTTWKYLLNSIFVFRPHLPGVFETNPYPRAVNGSLWTLKLEFLCYCTIALVSLIKNFRRDFLVFIILIILIATSLAITLTTGHSSLNVNLFCLFWFGVVYAEFFIIRKPLRVNFLFLALIVIFSALILASSVNPYGLKLLILSSLSLCAVHCAMSIRYFYSLERRLGDLSYGVYIYAFPVQQAIIHSHPKLAFSQHLIFSSFITLLCAFTSWRLIEKPALRMKPKANS